MFLYGQNTCFSPRGYQGEALKGTGRTTRIGDSDAQTRIGCVITAPRVHICMKSRTDGIIFYYRLGCNHGTGRVFL